MNAFTADVSLKKRNDDLVVPKRRTLFSRTGRVIYLIKLWLNNRQERKQ